VPAWAGFPHPPGGHLIDDGTWRVGHGPAPYWPAGTLLIESRRHFLDYADFEPAEAATLGPLIRRLTGPLKAATKAPRIHLFSCMEGTEHFHLWLVPRTGETPTGRGFIADPGYCSPAEAEDVIRRVRRAMESGTPRP
jgi:diadenosine tetraphosphate (Ap4A) HIT family hydrolase